MLVEEGQPAKRVVLLGASNLTRGIATVIETACRAWGRPLDLLAAEGLGRSYGMRSTVLGRSLPSILECGLWPALAARSALPTAALITDIGNDLFYGASPETIAGWVEQCCQRLTALDARLIMTRLPVCNIGRVRDWQYLAFRTVSYPGCRLSLDALISGARELDQRLLEVACRFDCPWIEPRARWYGLDPVHIHVGQARGAWQEILAGWADALGQDGHGPWPRNWAYLLSRVPDHRWILGREQRRQQPSGRLPDGTRLSFY
jgi:hypothetical protein